jgi:uncharacterized membrane protein YcgQ (UPF0703/DUF1980 family)
MNSCQKNQNDLNAQKFGGEVTLENAVALSEVYAQPDKYNGQEMRIDGTITEVCQHKGCWIKLTDGTDMLTVRFKDYGFFVPKNAANSKISIGGIFHSDVDSHVEEESQAQKDPDKDEHIEAAENTSTQTSYSFTADAVIIYTPASES